MASHRGLPWCGRRRSCEWCGPEGLAYLPTGPQMLQCVPLPELPPQWPSESSWGGLRLVIPRRGADGRHQIQQLRGPRPPPSPGRASICSSVEWDASSGSFLGPRCRRFDLLPVQLWHTSGYIRHQLLHLAGQVHFSSADCTLRFFCPPYPSRVILLSQSWNQFWWRVVPC